MNVLREKIKKTIFYPLLKKLYSVLVIKPRRLLLELRYKLIGIVMGIDIELTDGGGSHDYCQYQPAYTWYIRKIMKCFSINKSDKLLDYGSGKGAVMMFFAHYPFSAIDGIELIGSLHETAVRNFSKKGLHHLTSYQGDATQFSDIDCYTYFFLYNPFLGRVVESTIEQIRQSLIRMPRKIVILYQNPQEHDLFINSGLFPYTASCFVPSLINFNKNNRRYMRQFIDIYCTEPLDIDFAKYGIALLE